MQILESDGKTYKGLQVTVSREGKKPLVATWGGISLIWDINAPIDDLLKPYQWNKSELEKRLLAQVCEQCGATRATDRIEVHHIRGSKTWKNTQAERSRSGYRSWLPVSGKRWFFAIPAIWIFNMDAHTVTRYHVHGQAQPDDAGKP